jgi:hypothetical protein
MNNMWIIVVLAMVLLIVVFFRMKRTTGVNRKLMPRRLIEKEEAEEEQRVAAKEPDWTLKDLTTGGKIHFSLPGGLEEDYTVLRRDRVEWLDEQIEYDLLMRGDDPNHEIWLNWWTVGKATHAWFVEAIPKTPAELGFDRKQLDDARAGEDLKTTYRDQAYSLAKAGTLLALENGLRPGKEFVRWDFRNEGETRQILIQHKSWQGDEYRVYAGREIWLRDATVLSPRAGEASPSAAEE